MTIETTMAKSKKVNTFIYCDVIRTNFLMFSESDADAILPSTCPIKHTVTSPFYPFKSHQCEMYNALCSQFPSVPHKFISKFLKLTKELVGGADAFPNSYKEIEGPSWLEEVI